MSTPVLQFIKMTKAAGDFCAMCIKVGVVDAKSVANLRQFLCRGEHCSPAGGSQADIESDPTAMNIAYIYCRRGAFYMLPEKRQARQAATGEQCSPLQCV